MTREIKVFTPSNQAGSVTCSMQLLPYQSATVQVHRFGSEDFGGGVYQLEGSIDGSVYTAISAFQRPCFISIPRGLAYAQVRCILTGLDGKTPSLILSGVL